MPETPFEKNVFINCPFDESFEPILQAIMFAVVYLGFFPRIATESIDGGENRLSKIRGIIEASKFSIHDLSRCQARRKGEHFRLNMPFELGIDFGCRQYFGNGREAKRFLILEEKKYRYQAALSDIAGCDIQSYGSDEQLAPQNAITRVRNWLVSEAGANQVGPSKIWKSYTDFQEWYYEKKMDEGASEAEIKEYPTSELLAAMREWLELGMPI